jgi:hypothetical protein
MRYGDHLRSIFKAVSISYRPDSLNIRLEKRGNGKRSKDTSLSRSSCCAGLVERCWRCVDIESMLCNVCSESWKRGVCTLWEKRGEQSPIKECRRLTKGSDGGAFDPLRTDRYGSRSLRPLDRALRSRKWTQLAGLEERRERRTSRNVEESWMEVHRDELGGTVGHD